MPDDTCVISDTCGAFPAFARISGKFWHQGGHNAWFGPTQVIAEMQNSNAAITRMLRNGYFQGATNRPVETPQFTIGEVPSHPIFATAHLMQNTLAQSANPTLQAAWSTDPQREQWGHGYPSVILDSINGHFPIRQIGWSGHYSHVVGEQIRRRASLSDVTYWKCIRATATTKLVNGTWIVGDTGVDPALLPDYWVQIPLASIPGGVDSSDQVGSTYTTASFFDDERFAYTDDWKMDEGNLWKAAVDQLQLSNLRAAFDGVKLVPVPDDSGAVPYPIFLRAIVVAQYRSSLTPHWVVGNPFGFNPPTPFTGFLPKGWYIISGSTVYRLLQNLLMNDLEEFPNPATAPTFFQALGTRQSWHDTNYPSAFCNGATLGPGFFPGDPYRVLTRSFIKPLTFSKAEIKTQFIDMSDGGGMASVVPETFELQPDGITLVGMKEFRQVISLDGGVQNTVFDMPSDLTQHPLAEPTEGNAVSDGGEAGRCRVYVNGVVGKTPPISVNPFEYGYGRDSGFSVSGTKYQMYGSSAGPKNGDIEWITDRPTFIKAGQYITVEYWGWHKFTSPNYNVVGGAQMFYNASLTNPPPTETYFLYATVRNYHSDPWFFPNPTPGPANQPSPFGGNAYQGAALSYDIVATVPLYSPNFSFYNASNPAFPYGNIYPPLFLVSKSRNGVDPLTGYEFEIRDTRQLSDVPGLLYPYFAGPIRAMKSTPNEQIVISKPDIIRPGFFYDPGDGSGPGHFNDTRNMRWCDVRWFETDTGILAKDWHQIDPMVVVRQKINLSGGLGCA
jgi:hypothetical protein